LVGRVFLAALLATAFALPARAEIVAAESVYADIARQVAGPAVEVTAILENPAGDPHQFEPNPSVARRVAGAAIVIENGIGYDGWMDRLLAVAARTGQTRIVVADLLHRRAGDNPHLWYDPAAMPALTRALAATLMENNPSDRAAIAGRAAKTLASLAVLQARIDAVRQRVAGLPVAATEPVFGPMLVALGLADHHARFELAVMNGTEPRAGDVASIEDDLRAHRIRALITNAQATDTESARLARLAHAEHIPLVPVSETLPPGKTYQEWILGEVTALEAALSPVTTTQ
jgi:zinc/manganese transport system substrate-binding protein